MPFWGDVHGTGHIAGKPAIVGVRNDMCGATIRQQAGAYRRQRVLVFVGAGLPAIAGVWNDMCGATIRQQAGSYRRQRILVLWELACRRLWVRGMTCAAPRFASRLAPTEGSVFWFCGSWPAGDCGCVE
jgi:hypothetical protein